MRRMFAARPRYSIREHAGFSIALRPGSADEKVVQQSFERDIFFAALRDYVPADTDVLLDVGAHIGCFAVDAARRARSGVVHAIEASRESYNLLCANAALNGLDNIKSHHLALSDSNGSTTLYHDLEGNWGHSTVAKLSSRTEEVPTGTLARFLNEHGIERVQFAKFNCEGAEFPILLSAPDDALHRIERMLVLFHCDLAERYSLDQLADRVRKAGFDIEITANKKRRGQIVARRR